MSETGGGFGAVVCDCARDRGSIPMRRRGREHDTWFVNRGKLDAPPGRPVRTSRYSSR